jgi:proteasome beta subunit
VKLGYRDGMGRDETLDLVLAALFEAADEDSATGGPDLVRGIYPTMATITGAGFDRVDDAEIAARFRTLLDRLATTESSAAPADPAPSIERPEAGR